MKLYKFEKLSQKLDLLNFPEVKESRFEDTNKLFVAPENHDVRVDGE